MVDVTVASEEQLLGQRIRKYRELAGLRQADLARAIGTDAAAVSRLEAGTRRLPTTELGRIADALSVSVLALLEADSPLGDLAMAARTAANIDATTTRAHARGQRLMELYLVASDHLPPAPQLPTVPVVNINDLQASGEISAEWATALLEYPLDGEPWRLDSLADRIERCLGFDVLAEADPGGIDGLTTTMPGVVLIQVNTDRARRRALFTLAHELGHALMQMGTTSVTVDPVDPNETSQRFKAQSPTERWCNAFAVSLLVPERDVMRQVSDERDLDSLLRLYVSSGASWQTVVYRLHNLQYLTSARRRDELLSLTPQQWATTSGVSSETRALVFAVDVSASSEYRPPSRLASALYEGFLAGSISARPYADLMKVPVEDVLDMSRAS